MRIPRLSLSSAMNLDRVDQVCGAIIAVLVLRRRDEVGKKGTGYKLFGFEVGWSRRCSCATGEQASPDSWCPSVRRCDRRGFESGAARLWLLLLVLLPIRPQVASVDSLCLLGIANVFCKRRVADSVWFAGFIEQ